MAEPTSSVAAAVKMKEDNEESDLSYCVCQQRWDPHNPTFMIECNACHNWFHGSCVDVSESESTKFETWNCPNCSMFHGPPQLKMGLRKRNKRIDFAALNEAPADDSGGADLMEVDYVARLRIREKNNTFKEADGCIKTLPVEDAFTNEYVDRHGFEQPVLVKENTAQLGLRVPDPSFSVSDVARLGGAYRMLTVIDVSTQISLEYSLKDWADYFNTPPTRRERVLNVISFEFSKTPLNKLVTAPRFVREVDFVNLHWPSDPALQGDLARPHVGKYCLMSAEGSFTDFHVDFGGTSVWYHLFRGEKIFYFVRPTAQNLKIYAEWSTSGKQSRHFLGDLVSECYRVQLLQGHTLFIPSGWIHAVYTPKDSLVFGGNFVHKHSLEMQLRIYNLERKLKVDQRYKFPNYEALMWYAASNIVRGGDVSDIKVQPLHVLRGYKALAVQLRKWLKSQRTHKKNQFPVGMDVSNVVASLENILSQCVLKPPKPVKPPRPVQKKKKVPKEKKKIPKDKDLWAQCERCNEWRKVRKEPNKKARFCCADVKRVCKVKATIWIQCTLCKKWYIVDQRPREDEPFSCRDVNEQCAEGFLQTNNNVDTNIKSKVADLGESSLAA